MVRRMAIPGGRYRSRRWDAVRRAAWTLVAGLAMGALIAFAWLGAMALFG